jgi:hypothetical protein
MFTVPKKPRPVTLFSRLNLDSKALTDEVIARKRAREYTDVTIKDILNGRYEHVVFLGKG